MGCKMPTPAKGAMKLNSGQVFPMSTPGIPTQSSSPDQIAA
jgi:hypothetical protein